MSSNAMIGPSEKATGRHRTLGRVEDWWLPKVGPALAVAYCAALVFGVPGWAVLRSIALVAYFALCAGSYGYVLNDIFDIDVDRAAGKPNRLAALTHLQRLLLSAGLLALGFAPALLIHISKTTLIMMGLEYLVLTAYSAPPVRLKSRGILGVLCDASGAHIVANLFVIAAMANGKTVTARGQTAITLIALVCAWELCLGVIGILVHQLDDRENDLRSGIRTFATETTFGALRRPFTAVFLVELLAFAGLSLSLLRIAPLLPVALLAYALLVGLKVWMDWPHYQDFHQQATVLELWQLSHPFYEAFFPLAVALQCAWLHPQIWILVPLHLVVSLPYLRGQIDTAKRAYERLLLGCRLDVDQDSSARMRSSLLPLRLWRFEIASGNSILWKVRAVRPGLVIRSGQRYEIHLKVRSDKPRKIMLGIWQDHEPWEDVGFCEQVALSSHWQSIQRQFTAFEDEPRSCLALWLGGNPGAVELRRWSVRPLGKVAAASEDRAEKGCSQ